MFWCEKDTKTPIPNSSKRYMRHSLVLWLQPVSTIPPPHPSFRASIHSLGTSFYLEKLKCHHLMKALLEFIDSVVNSSQPSAHTAALACLTLWHCLITRLSPRPDLKKLMFKLQTEKLPSTRYLFSVKSPLPRMLLRNCLLSIKKKKKVEHDIIYLFGSTLFNSTLWMLTKYKVLVHISMYLNLGNWCHGASRLSQCSGNIYLITIKETRLQQKT